jgi:periplasmic protein TonB
MTDAILSSFESGGAPIGAPPPVKPAWLRPASVAGVVVAHAAVGWLLLKLAIPSIASLDSVSMELIPQGDYFEAQEVTAAEEEPPQPEEIETPDLAIPPPQVMSPEAPTLPQQREVVEKKKKIVEKKKDIDHDKKREAQTKRRIGAPEGQSQSQGMSESVYKALLAKVIREHTPSTAGLGEGSAHCTFLVTARGGITGISASGSSPAHVALARRVLSSIHAPPPPGGATSFSQSFHFLPH